MLQKMIIIEISDQHESFVNNDVLMNKFKKQREYLKKIIMNW